MAQYDEYVHKIRMENAQQEIIEKHDELIRMLADQDDSRLLMKN